MERKNNDHRRLFPSADQDRDRASHVVRTPQTESPAYRLAFNDDDFMAREELRPVRLQLELLKSETMIRDMGITSTVVMFGGARVPRPGADCPPERAWMAHFYDEARRFGRLVGEECMRRGGRDLVLATGGGPGVMEAGNLGAAEAGAPTMGLSIVLPHEQAPNQHVTPELSFNFHYFAIRKFAFLRWASACAVFPGGFGTMDELFEVLTLIQTGRMTAIPIVLFGERFWREVVSFEKLVEAGTIAPGDLELFSFVDTAEAGWEAIRRRLDAEGEVIPRAAARPSGSAG